MSRHSLLAVALFLGSLAAPRMATGEDKSALSSLTAEQVAGRMMEMDKWRVSTLQNYTVTRRYVLDNKRFHKHAEMVVRMTYTYPGKKEFEVLSEQGSGAVRKRVLRKLIETEIENARDEARNQTRITPTNYEFRILGTEMHRGRPCYVIEASPKTKTKLLFRGRIWVDAQDFAIAQIEGSPAKNPSFWTRKVRFVHRYEKAGPFWLAASNRSVTDVRIFGTTEVKIEYFDYQINQRQPNHGNSPVLVLEAKAPEGRSQ